MQPYYCQQVEGAAAFVHLEQEKNHLLATLEQSKRKLSKLFFLELN